MARRIENVRRRVQKFVSALAVAFCYVETGMDDAIAKTDQAAPRLVDILLVDDDSGDVQLTLEAFDDGRLGNRLFVAEDGEKAMAFLRREGVYADSPTPDLILLDLNMPRKAGHEVLADLRTDPALARIPVAIVTGSEEEGEILKAYNLGVACYITKPIDVTKLMIAVCSIPHFQVSIMTSAPVS